MNTPLSRAAIVLSLLLSAAAYAAPTPTTTPTTTTTAPVVAEAPAKTPWLYERSDVPVDTSWTFGVLPNGLKYAVKHNDVPLGQVSVRVRIDAGALHEGDDEQGFAHLLEHLSFRGSEYVPEGESKRIWQRLGVTFGSDSNAQTTPTETVYKLDLPSATDASLEESMKMLSGMMRAPNITKSALDAERAIVLAELREAGGAGQKYSDALREHMFQGQRLSKRETIGTPETLAAADAVRLAAFHHRWYRPELATVVIAGDADPSRLVGLVSKYFGSWKVQGAITPQPDFGKPEATGKVAATLTETSLPLSATLAYLRPWQPVDDTIVYNQQLLVDALAQRIINRRLENKARDGASFTTAQVEQEDFSRSADLTIVSIRPVGDDWEKAVLDARAVIADAMTTAPSPDDIAREITLFADVLRTGVDSYPFEAAAKQADDIVRAVDIRETVATPQTVVAVFEAMKNQFTPDRILASTQALFKGDVTRILLSGPAVDGSADIRLANAATVTVKPNISARLVSGNLGFDALPKLGAPATVTATNKDSRFDVETLTLSNGVRAILSPNKAENGQVRVLVRFGRGLQSVSPQKAGLLWAGPMVLPDNGVGKLTRSQLDQMINGRRIELSFNVDNDAFEYSSTTRPDDLNDQLRLIAAKMQNPGWQPAAVDRAKAFAKSDFGTSEMSAMAVMQRELQFRLSSNDPRWKSPDMADINRLTPASFKKFWQPLLATGPVEVMLFGDFDRDAAVKALQSSIGALPARKAVAPSADAQTMTFPAHNAAPMTFTHNGPADQLAAVIAWPTGGGLDAISEGRELEILAALFRDRLFEKFRAEQAASYSPDMASTWPDEFKSGGFLMAYSQVQPKDKDRFFAFAREVAADLAAKPIDADELKRAVEPAKQYVERASSGNMFWLSQMEGASYTPQRFTALTRLYSDYARVTPARIQELAKRYFRDDKAWLMVVEPKTKP